MTESFYPMQERKGHLFVPELPVQMSETIDALGFGTCNKIYLEFAADDVFWTAGEHFQVFYVFLSVHEIPL